MRDFFLGILAMFVIGAATLAIGFAHEPTTHAATAPEPVVERPVRVIDPIVLNMPDPPCWRTPVGHGVEFPSLVENHWPPVVCGAAGYYDFWCFHLEPVDDLEECRQTDPDALP